MRTLKFLASSDEKLINKLIREKKSSSFIIFYHSEWDFWSNRIVELAKAWAEKDGNEQCYVVSSWELPHVFSAFGINIAPSLVKVDRGAIKVFVEFPKVYDFFVPKKRQKGKGKRKGHPQSA
jgi:hypothetical protein